MAGSDVVIVGGGIIGAACAYELARSGASVTLLERDELAAGASGRNIGFFGLPWDPVLDPMATSSLQMYLEVTADPPVPSTSTASRSAPSPSPSTRTTQRWSETRPRRPGAPA